MNLTVNSILKIGGRVCDVVLVLVNGVLVSKPLTQIADLNGFGFWRQKNSTLVLNSEPITDATVELLVENWGRVNFGKLGQFYQYKGLWQVSEIPDFNLFLLKIWKNSEKTEPNTNVLRLQTKIKLVVTSRTSMQMFFS